ncbi:polysaccharide pyruvyl transferase CsaB [Tenggerimyces flavus]|uniref:Polysaccharide pyruvyl transferase CsaB n=1 Tax=Tenggerimyces flavus TaxID=1708749 RepID=A0ABV7YND3_9ACTN|nr:polysaccharide pyruvyl transferase CsaB [Tenggerimyces flavus]MBM7784476.1 polysaccharide pyruvyl transferase CsaB [Tenggerimyces flavus]
MKLVMLGYFGFGNAGDEAILAAELTALRTALGAETTFIAVSGDPAETRATHGIEAVSRTDFRALITTLRGADALIAGGGSLLQDVTSARPVAFYAGTMLIARTLGKPVFVYAQGLGPITRGLNRRLAGWALRSATYVSLRDESSIALATSLGARNATLVPDPVLGTTFATHPQDRLAIALRPWPGTWLPAVKAALTDLAKDTELVFVPFHGGQDVDLAHSLATPLGAEVVEPGDYGKTLEAVATSKATLGMRLHALITAAAATRPFVAIAYDPKVTAFAQLTAQPLAATLPEPPTPDTLITLTRKALEGPDQSYVETLETLKSATQTPTQAVASHLRQQA